MRGNVSKALSDYTKEELLGVIKGLKSRKKFGLVWEEKPEDVATMCSTNLPVLYEVEERAIKHDLSQPTNLVIEGDNYHSLSVLNYTHAGRVSCIFIDPPYNTGNKSWKYNNRYVESDDMFKHSKWLSFMSKRLQLSKNLLTDDGILIATIDDYEAHTLRLLLDEVFGEENRLATVIVINKKSGRSTDKFFATSHEYYYFYAKNIQNAKTGLLGNDESIQATFRNEDESGKFKWRDFLRTGGFSTPEERPNSHYPIFYDPKSGRIEVEPFADAIEIIPLDSKGKKRVWRQTRPSLMKLVADGDIMIQDTRNGYKVRIKDRIRTESIPKTVWDNPKYDAATHGTKLLEKVLGRPRAFDFPKSLYAVRDALDVALFEKDGAIVLDYFAGSGTTGHAVLELNRTKDMGLSFILCTNAESNIAEEVTYPRIANAVKGYAEVPGIPANIRYFKTDFVERDETDDKTRAKLVASSKQIIAVKEETFEDVVSNKKFVVMENAHKYSAIVFDQDSIPQAIQAIAKLPGDKPVSIYVFSLSNDSYEGDFESLDRKHSLKPIPEGILAVYRRIFDSKPKVSGE
jgi:adenine-specific DNA-methyltransferase